MEIGELGLLLELAVPLAEEGLKLTPEFATTHHLQMVVLFALDWPPRMLLATCRHAQLVIEFKKNYNLM
jgi:hypothetical protein